MYIVIFENGQIMKSSRVNNVDFEYCDDGILDIIDISLKDNPRYYLQGDWHEVESLDTN